MRFYILYTVFCFNAYPAAGLTRLNWNVSNSSGSGRTVRSFRWYKLGDRGQLTLSASWQVKEPWSNTSPAPQKKLCVTVLQ